MISDSSPSIDEISWIFEQINFWTNLEVKNDFQVNTQLDGKWNELIVVAVENANKWSPGLCPIDLNMLHNVSYINNYSALDYYKVKRIHHEIRKSELTSNRVLLENIQCWICNLQILYFAEFHNWTK